MDFAEKIFVDYRGEKVTAFKILLDYAFTLINDLQKKNGSLSFEEFKRNVLDCKKRFFEHYDEKVKRSKVSNEERDELEELFGLIFMKNLFKKRLNILAYPTENYFVMKVRVAFGAYYESPFFIRHDNINKCIEKKYAREETNQDLLRRGPPSQAEYYGWLCPNIFEIMRTPSGKITGLVLKRTINFGNYSVGTIGQFIPVGEIYGNWLMRMTGAGLKVTDLRDDQRNLDELGNFMPREEVERMKERARIAKNASSARQIDRMMDKQFKSMQNEEGPTKNRLSNRTEEKRVKESHSDDDVKTYFVDTSVVRCGVIKRFDLEEKANNGAWDTYDTFETVNEDNRVPRHLIDEVKRLSAFDKIEKGKPIATSANKLISYIAKNCLARTKIEINGYEILFCERVVDDMEDGHVTPVIKTKLGSKELLTFLTEKVSIKDMICDGVTKVHLQCLDDNGKKIGSLVMTISGEYQSSLCDLEVEFDELTVACRRRYGVKPSCSVFTQGGSISDPSFTQRSIEEKLKIKAKVSKDSMVRLDKEVGKNILPALRKIVEKTVTGFYYFENYEKAVLSKLIEKIEIDDGPMKELRNILRKKETLKKVGEGKSYVDEIIEKKDSVINSLECENEILKSEIKRLQEEKDAWRDAIVFTLLTQKVMVEVINDVYDSGKDAVETVVSEILEELDSSVDELGLSEEYERKKKELEDEEETIEIKNENTKEVNDSIDACVMEEMKIVVAEGENTKEQIGDKEEKQNEVEDEKFIEINTQKRKKLEKKRRKKQKKEEAKRKIEADLKALDENRFCKLEEEKLEIDSDKDQTDENEGDADNGNEEENEIDQKDENKDLQFSDNDDVFTEEKLDKMENDLKALDEGIDLIKFD